MSWFRRNKNDAYMQNTQTVSRPVGVVLTILMVLVVAAAVYCLFLGGRWIFKHLDGSNIPKGETVSVEVTSETPQNTTNGNTNGNSTSTNAGGSNTTSTNSNSQQNSTSAASSSSGQSSTSNQISAAGPGSSTVTSSQTNPSATSITATGPSNLIAVFAISTFLGALTYNLVLRKSIY